jgi:hypothetical protein
MTNFVPHGSHEMESSSSRLMISWRSTGKLSWFAIMAVDAGEVASDPSEMENIVGVGDV